ncbi:hypothetical protein BCR32DRAFT_233481 [Anaeromyces robustus]|uniref:Pescadillo homolog n=1 Tax=Anaeromyces robustus TaxID=1754192 RepID=A0A1Y1X4V1_9FUNG|nr:hypothetical protein BCR32DRAFT_233481 [Anaeromyces robustus]|eukprot:ORX80344.1 hypothetical protein BCR32DRAFT_233481 [Anaeromyces robustus]
MAPMKKKGERGAAANYITRNRAIKRLQISLADFRRLCILKGIYPREPKNKKKVNKGSTAPRTFYYVKDIKYLAHEPILEKFREYKTFAKKLKKALGKKEFDSVKSLEENKPEYTLDHLVKERYPTFIDALRDLDDALSMVFLFSTLPANDKIKYKTVENCKRLAAEFQHYVVISRSLKKTFLSIKGIYYQAEIRGQDITWIVPYQFSQQVPTDVDLRVMMTFLEFYQTLLGFVNYKLYSDMNLIYPPKIDIKKDEGNAGLTAYVVETSEGKDILKNIKTKPEEKEENVDKEKMKEYQERIKNLSENMNIDNEENEEEEEEEEANEETNDIKFEDQGKTDENEISETDKLIKETQLRAEFQKLFENCVFYLSREVPKYSLEFVIKAFGGKVGWDSSVSIGSAISENDPSITHYICDRPKQDHIFLHGVYVQPQWVYDCINAKKLLNTSNYYPGETLPPHLSPFVKLNETDYNPEEEIDEDEIMEDSEEVSGTTKTSTEDSEEVEDEEDDDDEEDEDEDEDEDKEEEDKEDENKKLAMIMMSKKDKRLYNQIQHSRNKKAAEVNKLKKKKLALQKK